MRRTLVLSELYASLRGTKQSPGITCKPHDKRLLRRPRNDDSRSSVQECDARGDAMKYKCLAQKIHY